MTKILWGCHFLLLCANSLQSSNLKQCIFKKYKMSRNIYSMLLFLNLTPRQSTSCLYYRRSMYIGIYATTAPGSWYDTLQCIDNLDLWIWRISKKYQPKFTKNEKRNICYQNNLPNTTFSAPKISDTSDCRCFSKSIYIVYFLEGINIG